MYVSMYNYLKLKTLNLFNIKQNLEYTQKWVVIDQIRVMRMKERQF